MRNVDVANIQFDYDLVFSVMFINGNGKVYSRYGGRTPWNAESRVSLEGLKYTMRQVLDAHQPHLQLADPPAETIFARDLPGLQGSCIHCHQVWEGLRRRDRRIGTFQPSSLYVYPRPENIGLNLDVDEGNLVVGIGQNSPAERARLIPGDRISRIGKTPVHSQADVSWALHNAPETGEVVVQFSRHGIQEQVTLMLEKHWKETKLSWRASMRHEKTPERHNR